MTKHFPAGILLLTALTLGVGPACLQASEPTDVHWLELCTATHNQRLTITTASGKVLEGYCLNVTQNELSLRSYDRGMVKIARGTLKRVFVTNG